MTDNGDYYVCEYDRRGHLVPAFGPYALAAAYAVLARLEQSASGEDLIPPSYTVRALPNHRRNAHGRT